MLQPTCIVDEDKDIGIGPLFGNEPVRLKFVTFDLLVDYVRSRLEKAACLGLSSQLKHRHSLNIAVVVIFVVEQEQIEGMLFARRTVGACCLHTDSVACVGYVRHEVVIVEALPCQPELRVLADWDLERKSKEIGKPTLSPLVAERCVMLCVEGYIRKAE